LDGGRRKDAAVVIWISKFGGGGISGSSKWCQSLFGVAARRRWARGVIRFSLPPAVGLVVARAGFFLERAPDQQNFMQAEYNFVSRF
jgi:hypothetical protein